MTRDEAITVLLNVAWLGTNEERERTEEAVSMAIEALEQETRTDTISREEALKLFATNDGKYLYEAIRDLPSVTPIPCSDAISRQAVMRILDEIGSDFVSPRDAVVSLDGIADAIQNLPSVKPKQNGWNLVSERLPKENGYYLTTTMYHEVYCDYWEENRFNRTEAVIAWMPLPAPFEPHESVG